jgi:hypothetical protein
MGTMKKQFSILAIFAALILAALAASPVNGGSSSTGLSAPGDAVPNSFIVILDDGVSSEDLASQHGIVRGRTFSTVFNGFSGIVPPGRVNALRNDPRVVSVTPNRVVHAHAKPDKPGGGKKGPANVTITSPSEGQVFSSSASISFEGTAIDAIDGDLTAGLAWVSDQDGAIGNGGSFSNTLSDGNHAITASVTDSVMATTR